MYAKNVEIFVFFFFSFLHCFSATYGGKEKIVFCFLLDVGRCKGKAKLFYFFFLIFYEPFLDRGILVLLKDC